MKNYIIHPLLEGNAPTHLKGLQIPLAPHLDTMILVWWAIFALTLAIVLFRGLLTPLYKKYR
jgi:hypothetical protein